MSNQSEPAASSTALPADGIKVPRDADPAGRFRELVARWKAESGFSSSSKRLAQHPAYREIVAMGRVAIPLLLAELKRAPDLWFAALREITGEDPVPDLSRGNLKEMAEAWLAWGRRHGYAD